VPGISHLRLAAKLAHALRDAIIIGRYNHLLRPERRARS